MYPEMEFLRVSNSEEDISQSSQAAIGQIQEVMTQKAVELFRVCDKEKKGYITRTDMQRLRAELQVSHDQLDVVFDSLASDSNGCITLQGFTDGFEAFLGLPSQRFPGTNDEVVDLYEGHCGTGGDALEDKLFHDMKCQIGATNIYKDEDVVKAMWLKLHREEPEMAKAFEEFIADLADDIRRSAVDFRSLEAALKSKHNEHEQEVIKLYEEMEVQIKQEREKILVQEKTKERQIRGEMETQLKDRETQLQDILARQQELEQKVSSLHRVDTRTKQENEQLHKERDQLEALLSMSQDNLEASRTYIQHMHLQQTDRKREKARVAQVVSEGISLERESLFKQLSLLRDINKKLRDDKDEAEATDARLRKSRETSYNTPAPVQGKNFVSKIQYYLPTIPVDGKGQGSMSQPK